MTQLIAEWIWFIGGVLWVVIRYPHHRKARKVKVARSVGGQRDQTLLISSLTGLAIIPLVYFVTGQPSFADYGFRPWLGWLGLILLVAALWFLYETHRELGRNWSVTLKVRDAPRDAFTATSSTSPALPDRGTSLIEYVPRRSDGSAKTSVRSAPTTLATFRR